MRNVNQTVNSRWSEPELLDAISAGEESAYRHLFDIYYQVLVTYAYRYLSDLDSSRNIVQDVFVGLYDKRSEIKIHTSLKAHLYQSVRNRALNVIKREKMQREHHSRIMDEHSNQENYEHQWAVKELEGRIAKVVNELPGQCQRIFRMSRQEGLLNAEIAEQLSISKRTVETQISKALKKIREDLKKNGYLSFFPILWGIIDQLF
jgi:RNA polymerase sigma-70 factor (ECF subfamily)